MSTHQPSANKTSLGKLIRHPHLSFGTIKSVNRAYWKTELENGAYKKKKENDCRANTLLIMTCDSFQLGLDMSLTKHCLHNNCAKEQTSPTYRSEMKFALLINRVLANKLKTKYCILSFLDIIG